MLLDNLEGQKFGRLTAIYIDKSNPKTASRWVCKCECGHEKSVFGFNLKNGHVKSCGCLGRESRFKEPHTSGINSAIRAYKANAKSRNHIWGISDDEFIKLSSSNCFYCGTSPNNISKGQIKDTDRSSYIYNGLDRVDNSKGYTIDNVVPCCFKCNFRKKDFSVENMIKSLEFLGYSIRLDNSI